ITVFVFISLILLIALLYQCFDKHCGRRCGRCWGKGCHGCCDECCDGCGVGGCGGCCCGCCCRCGFGEAYCDEYRACRLEIISPSTHTVHCVEKHITERAIKYDFSGGPVRVSQREKQALCSVCDGKTVYVITLKGEQIDKLQEGKTYIIKNATVKQDHPYFRIILGSGTTVFQTAPLELDENLKTVQWSFSEEQKIPVRDVVIEENGFRVPVTLLQEAAIKPLAKDKFIEITHVTVDKYKRYGTDLTSSDYTVVHENTEESDGRIRVEGFAAEDSRLVLLTENQEELSVSQNRWPGDLNQLPQQLPVDVTVSRQGRDITRVDILNAELSSIYKVHCVEKHITERAIKYDFSGDPVRVSQREKLALCSVCDGTTVYLITLKEEHIDKLQKGKTYIIKDATVEEDHPYFRIILESGTAVFQTAPLQLNEKLICRAKESINPSSKRIALYDPGLLQKEGYITLSGKVREASILMSPGSSLFFMLKTVQRGLSEEQEIPVRDVVIEENGVSESVTLLQEAAIKPLAKNQLIEITHVTVDKNKRYGTDLTSSDYTVVHLKCFERLVMRHIKTLLPPSLDPLQFAYHPNHSMDDAISTTLHLALTRLDNRDTYVRMLFIGFSSAFNTIIPQHLIGKLNLLGLNTSLSNWILDVLTGRPHTITKKAQQRLYFLRRLRKAHLPPPILTTFYRGTIESILSSCITAWFGNCTASDRKSLQRVVRTAEKIIGVSLPTITDIYTTRCNRKANSIVDDHTHPSHTLFTLLPSGKSSSIYKVHCVAKHIEERATKYDFSGDPVSVSQREKLALCSVCDGTTVYLITLKEEQIDKLQKGKTYIIKDATVKEDHPYSRIILESGTAVSWTTRLQLNEKLICRAKESINPSSERTALNDPGRLQKEGYITLSGKVQEASILMSPGSSLFFMLKKTVQRSLSEEKKIPVRDVVIEENGVSVSVTLLQEAAIKPLAKNQLIEITHITVDKNKRYGTDLTSSDYTVVHENTEESDRRIRVEGFAAEHSRLVLLTENQEELNVPRNLWLGDPNQLPQQLPVDVSVTRRGQDITRVDILKPELSSIYKVHCVKKHMTECAIKYDFSGDPLKTVQRGLSEEQEIPVRDVVIEKNSVRVSVTLLQEAAIKPLAKNQLIEITHVTVDKYKTYGNNLTSSDYTVVHSGLSNDALIHLCNVLTLLNKFLKENTEESDGRIKVEGSAAEDNRLVLLTENQEELSVPQNLWLGDPNQLPQHLPVDVSVSRRGQDITRVDILNPEQ
ncbi:hypothetical protein NFI96_032657, partial [Prochilodus magdalenae]